MTTFFIIGGAGIALLVIALFVGDILDGFLDVDALAGLDSDIFSTAGVAGLLGGFGFAGAIGYSISDSMTIAIICGLIVGILLAIGAGKLTGALRNQESSADNRTAAMIGTEARVLTHIPHQGYGQVRLTFNGTTRTLNAKAAVPIDANTRVWVSGVLSPTSVEVTPIDPAALDWKHDA